ncbi:MAG: hypothetical protein LKJ69_04980 [Lactobacillus sp.]|jgi:hypothetical protein|nr:hypothetical protein [Lactobacillus sp.]MCI2032738.1 hypothetical protein [Lactobacillus sp.]
MTKIKTQIQNRRRALLILQAALWVTMAFQSAIWQAITQLDDPSSQGAGWLTILSGGWLSAFFSLRTIIVLVIAVASVRLAVFLVVTSTTQSGWLWGLLLLGGAMGLTAVVALFWGFAANTTIAWRIGVWACAGDFMCTLVARPQLATSAEGEQLSAS